MNVLDILSSPASTISKESDRQKASLLSVMLFAYTFLVFAQMIVLQFTSPEVSSFGWIATFFYGLIYILSRTRFYKLSALIFSVTVTGFILIVALEGSQEAAVWPLVYLPVSLLVSGIVLSSLQLVAVMAVTLLVIMGLWKFGPESMKLTAMMTAFHFGILATLILVVSYLRDKFQINLEKAHRNIAEEKVRKELAKKLTNLNKMSSIGEVSAGIVHEISNPITIVSGHVEKLIDYTDRENLDRVQMKSSVDKINQSVLRIVKIIDGLKGMSRVSERDPFEKAGLGKIVNDAVEYASENLKKHGIKVSVDEIPENLYVMCRSVEITHVILNLILNSIDAIKNKNSKWIRIQVVQSDENIEVLVTDSGLGIPKDIRNKILQPFFSTKEKNMGVGLGLSISKKIAEFHRGKLHLDEGHQNTRFILQLPKG